MERGAVRSLLSWMLAIAISTTALFPFSMAFAADECDHAASESTMVPDYPEQQHPCCCDNGSSEDHCGNHCTPVSSVSALPNNNLTSGVDIFGSGYSLDRKHLFTSLNPHPLLQPPRSYL